MDPNITNDVDSLYNPEEVQFNNINMQVNSATPTDPTPVASTEVKEETIVEQPGNVVENSESINNEVPEEKAPEQNQPNVSSNAGNIQNGNAEQQKDNLPSDDYTQNLLNPQYRECYEKYVELLAKHNKPEERIQTVFKVGNGLAHLEVMVENTITGERNVSDFGTFDYTDSTKYALEDQLITAISMKYAETAPLLGTTLEPVGLDANLNMVKYGMSALSLQGISNYYARELQEKVVKFNRRFFNGQKQSENVQEMPNNMTVQGAASPEQVNVTPTVQTSYDPSQVFTTSDIEKDMMAENQLDQDLYGYGNLEPVETEALKQEMEKENVLVRKLVKNDDHHAGKMSRPLVITLIVIVILALIFVTYKILN